MATCSTLCFTEVPWAGSNFRHVAVPEVLLGQPLCQGPIDIIDNEGDCVPG